MVAGFGRGLGQQFAHDVVGRFPLERRLAGEAFEKSRTEAVDVVAGVGNLGIAGLFGTHVGGRAHERAAECEAGARVDGMLGEAEVGQLGGAAQVEHDVVGLDVAVHDGVFFREHERMGDAGNDGERLRFR